MAEEAEAVEGAPAAEVAVPAGPIASPELLEACMLGKAMKIKSYLQKHDAEEINWPTAKNGWSCLQVAAGYGMADACRALVEAGAKLDAKDNLGMTALHAGSDTDETEVMRALLETDAGKAMVNVQDNVRGALHGTLYSDILPRAPRPLTSDAHLLTLAPCSHACAGGQHTVALCVMERSRGHRGGAAARGGGREHHQRRRQDGIGGGKGTEARRRRQDDRQRTARAGGRRRGGGGVEPEEESCE